MFQFYNLIPSLTARENVALVTDIAHDPLEPEEALALVGLGDRLDHFPAQLSGGEQQRVAIARALAKRPECLLCDEPTGALDIETGRLVLDALARANRELNTTTIVITHNATIAGMARASIESGKYDAYVEQGTVPRFGRPEDVAKVVRLLLEPDSYITGQVITVDGGLTLRR